MQLPADALAAIAAHAAGTYPEECCGILAGVWPGGGTTRVRWVARARNVERERRHDRYELDTGDFLRVDREARQQGLEIVGFYHSHPGGRPVPSRYDAERAWPAYTYLIAGVQPGGPVAVRAWVFDPESEAFVEQCLETVPG